jgi:phage shock protein PspC (stress-responsive transcriptional regulator)
MCKNATELLNADGIKTGLLQLDPKQATLGWVIMASCGFVSALSMYLYNVWLMKQAKKEAPLG